MDGAEKTKDQMLEIASYLLRAKGLNGQPRRTGGLTKKIQSGISMSLKRAKDTIGEHLPDLKEYLSHNISGKGGYAYTPYHDQAIEWNFGES